MEVESAARAEWDEYRRRETANRNRNFIVLFLFAFLAFQHFAGENLGYPLFAPPKLPTLFVPTKSVNMGTAKRTRKFGAVKTLHPQTKSFPYLYPPH